MKTRITSSLLAALVAVVITLESRAATTAFTYQGRLNQNGVPATGLFDVRFEIFDAMNAGAPITGPITNAAVAVTNGLLATMLDFGFADFTGSTRWLDIKVRPAGGGAFTTLTPRQLMTATLVAVTALSALNVPGVSGHSLHAQDGSPANAVFVDDAGRVGVGTTGPGSQFHVASRPDEPAPPRLQSTGNTRFNAGWDFYHGGTGRGYVGVPDVNAPIAPGEMVLFGGTDTKASVWAGQVRALTANTAGDVGIGTDTPAARLEVRGDIRLGSSGQFRATSSEENLRIVRGLVNADGGVLRGAGFQVSRNGVGYAITLDTPFSGSPVVTSSVDLAVAGGGLLNGYAVVDNAKPGSFEIFIYSEGGAAGPEDRAFHFIAIGPR